MSYTLTETGKVLTETFEGITMPADYSFATVNDFVHGPDVNFEELQCLALGMANEIEELKAEARKVGAGRTATVTKQMIFAAHDVMLAKGDFILSANLLERIYLAMEQAAPPPQARFDTCPTCEALARLSDMARLTGERT